MKTTHYCGKCKQYKPLSEFRIDARRNKPDPPCKLCRQYYAKQWYQSRSIEHKAYVIKKQLPYRQAKVKEKFNYVVEYLRNHPCTICGESDIVVLEFDHLRDKKHNIAVLIHGGWGLNALKKEIEKCQVLCANCHRRKTAREQEHPKWILAI